MNLEQFQEYQDGIFLSVSILTYSTQQEIVLPTLLVQEGTHTTPTRKR